MPSDRLPFLPSAMAAWMARDARIKRRLLEKAAVLHGGGVNHRMGLHDGVLIKDNHIAAAGGIGPALERCLAARRPPQMRIEVETRNLAEVAEGLKEKDLVVERPPKKIE